MSDMRDMKMQLAEAIDAGEHALSRMAKAESALSGAAGWGVVDLLGGGLITTMLKRGKMKEAQEHLDGVNIALQRFQHELRDVTLRFDHVLVTDDFLTFADYVFDDFLSDFLVQRRIDKAKKALRDTQREVRSIVQALRQTQRTL